MASVCISIENETTQTLFNRALDKAGSGASDMIVVRTMVDQGSILKTVRTNCPWAISVFRSFDTLEAAND